MARVPRPPPRTHDRRPGPGLVAAAASRTWLSAPQSRRGRGLGRGRVRRAGGRVAVGAVRAVAGPWPGSRPGASVAVMLGHGNRDQSRDPLATAESRLAVAAVVGVVAGVAVRVAVGVAAGLVGRGRARGRGLGVRAQRTCSARSQFRCESLGRACGGPQNCELPSVDGLAGVVIWLVTGSGPWPGPWPGLGSESWLAVCGRGSWSGSLPALRLRRGHLMR